MTEQTPTEHTKSPRDGKNAVSGTFVIFLKAL